jgi:hypothetical protein
MSDAPAPAEPAIDDEGLISPCLCRYGAIVHAQYCRLGVLLARMERPKDLFRITTTY